MASFPASFWKSDGGGRDSTSQEEKGRGQQAEHSLCNKIFEEIVSRLLVARERQA